MFSAEECEGAGHIAVCKVSLGALSQGVSAVSLGALSQGVSAVSLGALSQGVSAVFRFLEVTYSPLRLRECLLSSWFTQPAKYHPCNSIIDLHGARLTLLIVTLF